MSTSFAVVVLRLVISLGIVLALMALAARVLRKRQGGGGASKGTAAIEVVTRQQLTKNGAVAVVRIGAQTLLVGISDSSVRLLAELPDFPMSPPRSQRPALSMARGGAGVHSLVDNLRELTVRR